MVDHRYGSASAGFLSVLMAILEACGSRSPLEVELLRLPPAPSGPGPAETRDSGGSHPDANVDPPEPACSRWSVTPATILSPSYVDFRLSSAVTTGECVLVGFTTSNGPPRDLAWRVACVPFDAAGPLASSIFLDRPSSGAATGPVLAFGFGHGGAAFWDGFNGCRFATVDERGIRTSAAHVISSSLSCGILATPKGFAQLEDDRLARTISLQSLDTSGTSTGTTVLVTSKVPITSLVRAQARDGSFLLVWREAESMCSCVQALNVRHFSADSSPLGDRREIQANPTFLTIAATRTGFLAAWAEAGTINLTALDADGSPSGRSTIIESPPGEVVHGLRLARVRGDQMMLAWARSRKGDIGTAPLILARPLFDNGSTAGEELVVATPPFGGSLRIVSTPIGALVAFEGENSPPTMVAASALLCGD